jgi:hypothetical protein
MTLALPNEPPTGELSSIRSLYVGLRVKAAWYLSRFLRTPLAWVIIAGIAFGTWWQSDLREGNRLACAATSVTIDQQIFRDGLDGGTAGGINFHRACSGLALPGPIWARMRTTRNWAF